MTLPEIRRVQECELAGWPVSQAGRGASLADDGAGLGVADEHARDEVVGLRLHAGLALQVLVHPHMHLVQRILQP